MRWRTAVLGDVLQEARPGFASGSDLSDGIAQVRMNNLTREGTLDWSKVRRVETPRKIKDLLLEPGDVLFNTTNSPELVGKTAFFGGYSEPLTFSNHFLRLRPIEQMLDGRFLAHWMQREFAGGRFQRMCKQWVNQATVSRDLLLALKIPLPPLDEQRRIAAIFDKAEDLRAKRRAALALLDRLPSEYFYKLFGDPMTDTRWPRVAFSELVAQIESGWSPPCLDRPAKEGEWGVLKVGAVTRCHFRPSENKALPPGLQPDPKLEVRTGDILFTRKNTLDLVAACAVVEQTPPRLMMPDLVFRFRLKHDAPLDVNYLHGLLVYPTKRRSIQLMAGGSAGSMPNISKARLMELPIEVPHLELQRKYSKAVRHIGQMKQVQLRSLAKIDSNLRSLQALLFESVGHS